MTLIGGISCSRLGNSVKSEDVTPIAGVLRMKKLLIQSLGVVLIVLGGLRICVCTGSFLRIFPVAFQAWPAISDPYALRQNKMLPKHQSRLGRSAR